MERAAALLGYSGTVKLESRVVGFKDTGGVRPEDFEGTDGVGVGKLLVGPNGPVDAIAAAKVAAAGTMPVTVTKMEEPVHASVNKAPIAPKQSTLRCDCCSVTVNSQHQLDLHLNGEVNL